MTGISKQNHYDTLGVSKTATQEDIKKAYFRLCKEYHPDKHANNTAKSDKFLKINDAYNVLSNAQSRHEYDTTISRRPFRGQADYTREHWSSAYRSNPYVRNERTRQNWSDFNHSRYNDFSNRQRPRDNLDRYWDEYYRHKRSWESNQTGSFSPPRWMAADRVVSFFVVIVCTILLMRFMAAGLAWRSRSAMQELELQRHLEVRREAEEARERLKTYKGDQPKSQNSHIIPPSKLEDA